MYIHVQGSSAFFFEITCTLVGPTGKLHYLQEGGECVERGKMEGQPLFLCLHNPRQLLAVVTHNMMLTQYSVNMKGETTVLMNVCTESVMCGLFSSHT